MGREDKVVQRFERRGLKDRKVVFVRHFCYVEEAVNDVDYV
jgi:hypothetical protein